MFLDLFLVAHIGLPDLDGQSTPRALSDTGSQPVAIGLADQLGLAVYDGNSSFGAGGDTASATVAFLLIDFDDLSFHAVLLLAHEQLLFDRSKEIGQLR
jgi:hypothetical protein